MPAHDNQVLFVTIIQSLQEENGMGGYAELMPICKDILNNGYSI